MNPLLIFMEEEWAGLDVLTEEILESSPGYWKSPQDPERGSEEV